MDPLIYQYVLGGVVFLLGLGYARRQGYLGLSGRPAAWLAVLLGGLAGYAGLQGVLQYAPMSEAAPIPFAGTWEDQATLGTPLDYLVIVAYFIAILSIGTWFGRGQTTTKDFFFGGQRFSWWLIAASLIATLIGSYSFVKYSKVGFTYGLSSSQSYLNDWFWVPLLLFGWLPLLYFSRITSLPEYFARRFGPTARGLVTALLLVYLVGYVGINLFTMGKALNQLLGWNILLSAVLVATISAVYVTAGGQTSVIMTDLFQGVMLLVTGLVLLILGVIELGGPEALWTHLPRGHRQAFSSFSDDPAFPAAGIFWQDAIANSAMFYFLNQGILMRFMAARSLDEGRKAVVAVVVLLMPIAAVVVASGGWVGAAFVHAGLLPADVDGGRVFFIVAEMLAVPGMFGLILAALTAALMSTVDTLVTAVAAVVVNDVVRPLRPDATDPQLLRAARLSSVGVSLVGVLLVTVFQQFDSIYEAHGAFTAAVTPPMVVALLMGVFWRRYTPAAAVATLAGGALAVAASIVFPELITPFAAGIDPGQAGEGLLGGMKQHKYMRAAYGLAVSAGLGVIVTPLTRARPLDEVRGYVWGTVPDAIRRYKGSDGIEGTSDFLECALRLSTHEERRGLGQLPVVSLSSALAGALEADEGALVYVSDRRWWLGGLRATHGIVGEIVCDEARWIALGPPSHALVARGSHPVRIQRIC
ncbi:MAG TPA: sodium:solute symporter family protein [Deltaproteobacteria bacterium]|nr:sodium:solute symporter family protein [Deltaproteobacteria bacterium]